MKNFLKNQMQIVLVVVLVCNNSCTIDPPVVSTVNITDITTTSAKSGGSVTDNGGSDVTARGVCWSTDRNPTLSSDKTNDGSGNGSFTSTLTGLTANTSYYVRAYATNSEGTSYGNEVTFKTSPAPLVSLSTTEISSVTPTSAICGGIIIYDGGSSITEKGICWSTTINPDLISGQKIIGGSGSGNFTLNLTGLLPGTKYYVRAYAINGGGTAYGDQASFTTLDPSKITDSDGNIYNIITIGTQIWLAENLKTVRYNDGTIIPSVTGTADWSNLTTPGFCWYENNATTYKNVYGALYNWYAVNTGKLCPDGWRVASDNDWTTLTNYLAGESVAGGKLKATGTIEGGDGLWHSPNTEATNKEGFTALPGGYRLDNGIFEGIGLYGNWWTSSEASLTNAWTRGLDYDLPYCYRYDGHSKNEGYSVRCVKN